MNRLVEAMLALILAPLLAPVMGMVAILILLVDGRPVFFLSERVRQGGSRFGLIKFRTMIEGTGPGVTGGDKAARITRLGAFLRRRRLDELPQILNVLRGEIGFVGPRPPAPEICVREPELYAEVLKARPGITGLATLAFAAHEERLLARGRTAAETEAIYLRRCVSRKAHIDLIHARNRSTGLDLWLMVLTGLRIVLPPGKRLWRARLRPYRRPGIGAGSPSVLVSEPSPHRDRQTP